ncbi:cysteine desulfurase family protein [Microbacterium sp. No. 7]|uniref:cysteine desulfurase family protein n=1 Tax=Microbacterium sp. No. 7 TaxID=1714373 RepID=UPI0006CFFA24|nr:cysteine desulfurase family protein [Microbacterium sp. No. 7]ALJ20290.1 cysteine desulfurase [Microbacterium sp. No. 7]
MSIYLDHAATTALRPEARDAWLHASQQVGNASSVHAAGRAARRLLEGAREEVAAGLGCEPIEVVLTSGGTESINLALKGLWWAWGGSVVLPDGEHHATLETAEWLHAQGAPIRRVALDAHGAIPVAAFAEALAAGARDAGDGPAPGVATAVVANNEVGTVNDAAGLAAVSAAAGVALHLDAVGAVGQTPVDFAAWRAGARGGAGLVALSVSGHKLGAPAGTGALVVSRHAEPVALLHGGGQQRGLRSGTPDVAGAVALAAALRAAVAEREHTAARLRALRDELVAGVRRAVPDAVLLGDPERRLPGNAHFLFPGARGETLLFLLDAAGVSASTGSACQAGIAEPSHVVMAMGHDEHDARCVLRFTLGRTSDPGDVTALLAALPDAVARSRAAG